MDEQLKQTLREKLQMLSKDELIEIITNISSVYVAMSVLSRVHALDSEWFKRNGYDYLGLIEKGLAVERKQKMQ